MHFVYNRNPSETDLRLNEAECHLWQIPPSAGYANLLAERERKRYLRFTHPHAREEYAASQGGLRAVLARYVGCPPENVVLHRGERGKPHLPGGPEFNLSHSAGLVCLAVASQPVGLDIERAGRRGSFAALASKFFTPAEQRRISAAPPGRQNELFLRHWVGKEASVKLSGEGIFRGLRHVEIVGGPGGGFSGLYRGRPVYLLEFRPAPGYLAALASWRPLRIRKTFLL
jgi:Phosphopantetheinyl transferase